MLIPLKKLLPQLNFWKPSLLDLISFLMLQLAHTVSALRRGKMHHGSKKPILLVRVRRRQLSTSCGRYRKQFRRDCVNLCSSSPDLFFLLQQALVNVSVPLTIFHQPFALFNLRRWSFFKLMSHEPLATGLFNLNFTSDKGQWAAWQTVLVNNEPLLQLLVSRMSNDYEQLTPKMRKPFAMKDIDPQLK